MSREHLRQRCAVLTRVTGLVAMLGVHTACAFNPPPAPPPTSLRSVTARLYDLVAGDVTEATFMFDGTTYGTIAFTLPSGERFRGEYQTVTAATSAWGTIYSHAWTLKGLALRRDQAAITTAPEEYFGSALAASDRKRIIECEYITNTSPTEPHGQGACRDNQGHTYKLMF